MAITLNGTTGITSTGITETSDGNVGIGTSSPSRTLHVNSGTTDIVALFQSSDSPASISFYDGTGGTNINNVGNEIYFRTGSGATGSGGTERLRITPTGVGIGTSSPSTKVEIKADSNSTTDWVFTARNSAGSAVTEIGGYGYNHNLYHRFWINDIEKMRIDSSGNLLVGKTTPDTATAGVTLNPTGYVAATVSGNPSGYFRRLSTDGNIVEFRKNSTVVGSIGTGNSNRLFIGQGDTGIMFDSTNNAIYAWNTSTNGVIDNAIDLGYSSIRFDDIYATNGTIQTSDRNEKQDIETLSEAETRVAVACKGLLRKFRWKDSVAEKGDEARIHFGIIAQDLQDAFTAEGLDAGRYAMFISSTWWEAERVVPAVEEVLDDEGNVTTKAVAEHTVTETYATAEEAPEGATERTRLGVRYPELLAFIIGAI